MVVNNGLVAVCPCSIEDGDEYTRCSRWNDHIEDGDEYTSAEDEANARLIAAAPTMLDAIETAGRIVGQVQDNPKMSAGERAYALSRACDALGGTYFKATGKPLEWWQAEAAIAKATGQEGVGVCGGCGVSASDALGEYSPDEFFVCVECQWDDEHDTHDEQCKCKATGQEGVTA